MGTNALENCGNQALRKIRRVQEQLLHIAHIAVRIEQQF